VLGWWKGAMMDAKEIQVHFFVKLILVVSSFSEENSIETIVITVCFTFTFFIFC
jgi:hypothetical protein